VLVGPAAALQWQNLTAEDAEAIVVAFEGGSAMQFTTVELDDSSAIGNPPPHAYGILRVYELSTADDSRQYSVCQRWQHLFRFYDPLYAYAWVGGEDPEAWEAFYGQPYSQAELLALQMSLEDAQEIATAYAQAHCPDFSLLNNVVGGTPNDTTWGFSPCYAFRFYYRTDTGTYALNALHPWAWTDWGEM
jgi:hypothetical protein